MELKSKYEQDLTKRLAGTLAIMVVTSYTALIACVLGFV
jgi:hypothetical protein